MDTLGDMPWCPYHADGRIKWALRKNVPETSYIDIKTMAEERKKGRNNDCAESQGSET